MPLVTKVGYCNRDLLIKKFFVEGFWPSCCRSTIEIWCRRWKVWMWTSSSSSSEFPRSPKYSRRPRCTFSSAKYGTIRVYRSRWATIQCKLRRTYPMMTLPHSYEPRLMLDLHQCHPLRSCPRWIFEKSKNISNSCFLTEFGREGRSSSDLGL